MITMKFAGLHFCTYHLVSQNYPVSSKSFPMRNQFQHRSEGDAARLRKSNTLPFRTPHSAAAFKSEHALASTCDGLNMVLIP